VSPVADCDLKAVLECNTFPKDDFHLLHEFFGSLCSAILYFHNSKCKHKDSKPGNILIYKNRVLIADFGTAMTGVNSHTIPRLVGVAPSLLATVDMSSGAG
jgi:serine/threonine protein kinase